MAIESKQIEKKFLHDRNPIGASKFVGGWRFRCRSWSIFSILLIFFTFAVASQPSPTTVIAGPTPSINPPTPSLNPISESQNLRTLTHLNRNSKIAILVGVFVFCVFVVMGLMAFLKLFRCGISRSEMNQVDDIDDQHHLGHDHDLVRKFGWEEIERLTGNFSTVIGIGGFSNVFLADFGGGNYGAIKIYNASERLHQVFKQELDILLLLRHQNIVNFMGYCDDRDEGALVFEYVPNGNLQEKLHEKTNSVLPWRNRVTIAFQLAKALHHLHENCPLQIVHGDIKSSNILLDDNLNIKLCDFGFAKMGFSSTVLPSPASLIMGSPGYTDPHYLRTGIASKKNDVYSFGVIILELITGIDAFCSEKGQQLTTIAAPMLKESVDVTEMVDRRLGGEFDVEEAKVMVSLAAACTGQSPTLRPSVSQILKTMEDEISSVLFVLPPAKDCKIDLPPAEV